MNQNYIIDGLGFTGSILIGLTFIPQEVCLLTALL